ncbi:hypothetical protein PROFUN_15291 [Planoprotostelium fungivorum]|uniref:Uncharacterized protein n=1 Tax=Planoprotostelium fungivorum TaxID=1890364 RepID=A0A2P6MMA7_9EUKA|nr:hypothetical protein PROFUN_15291 [Planoprotostelium fungivorum]
MSQTKTKIVDPRTLSIPELEVLLRKNEDLLQSPISKKLPDGGQKIRNTISLLQQAMNEKKASGQEEKEKKTISNLEKFAYREKTKEKKESTTQNFIQDDEEVMEYLDKPENPDQDVESLADRLNIVDIAAKERDMREAKSRLIITGRRAAQQDKKASKVLSIQESIHLGQRGNADYTLYETLTPEEEAGLRSDAPSANGEEPEEQVLNVSSTLSA